MNIENITSQVEKSCRLANHPSVKVRILGASKGQGADKIRQAYDQGIHLYGENKVQEATAKWPALKKELAGVTLHLIGPLQTNKVSEAVELFDAIQTIDRAKLAAALASEMAKQNRFLPCFIQVNTGFEPQKAGVLPGEADDFIRHCRDELKLNIVGLMCIPPADEAPKPHFEMLAKIALAHGLEELSMGMSEDFETAIASGATIIRLGRALFGERV